jgi:hypothetical protein
MENDLFKMKANCKLAKVPSGTALAKLQRILVKRITTFINTAQQPASQLPLSRSLNVPDPDNWLYNWLFDNAPISNGSVIDPFLLYRNTSSNQSKFRYAVLIDLPSSSNPTPVEFNIRKIKLFHNRHHLTKFSSMFKI